jgi:hypothetical protein
MRNFLIFYGEINYDLGKEEINNGDFWIRDCWYNSVYIILVRHTMEGRDAIFILPALSKRFLDMHYTVELLI